MGFQLPGEGDTRLACFTPPPPLPPPLRRSVVGAMIKTETNAAICLQVRVGWEVYPHFPQFNGACWIALRCKCLLLLFLFCFYEGSAAQHWQRNIFNFPPLFWFCRTCDAPRGPRFKFSCVENVLKLFLWCEWKTEEYFWYHRKCSSGDKSEWIHSKAELQARICSRSTAASRLRQAALWCSVSLYLLLHCDTFIRRRDRMFTIFGMVVGDRNLSPWLLRFRLFLPIIVSWQLRYCAMTSSKVYHF